MIISIEEEQNNLGYQETRKVAVENIVKLFVLHFEKNYYFFTIFFRQMEQYSKQPQFLPSEIKVVFF